MERFNAMTRGAQLMLVASVLLLIDSFLDWQQVEFELLNVSASEGVTAWHGIGVVMGLFTIALVGWLVLRLLDVRLELPVSAALVTASLAAGVVLFTVIKFLVANEFRNWPAWVGLILAIVIAVGAWMDLQDAGGLDRLRADAASMSARRGGGTTTAPPPDTTTTATPDTTTAPAAPPAAPSAPAAPAAPAPPVAPPAPASPAQPPPPVEPGSASGATTGTTTTDAPAEERPPQQ